MLKDFSIQVYQQESCWEPRFWLHSLPYDFMLPSISIRIGNCKNMKSKSLLSYVFPYLLVEQQWLRRCQGDWQSWLTTLPPERNHLIRSEMSKRQAGFQGRLRSTDIQTPHAGFHPSQSQTDSRWRLRECAHNSLGKLSVRNISNQSQPE